MFRRSALRAPPAPSPLILKLTKCLRRNVTAVPRSPFPNYNGPRMHFVLLSIQSPYRAFWLNWPSRTLIKRKQIFVIYVYLGQVQFSSYEIEKGNLMFSSKNWNFFHFNFLHQGLCQSIICHRFSIQGSLMLEQNSGAVESATSVLVLR